MSEQVDAIRAVRIAAHALNCACLAMIGEAASGEEQWQPSEAERRAMGGRAPLWLPENDI